MLPVERFFSFINKHHLFEASDRILLAISGGRDSVFMAELFKQAGLRFAIAHCNFRLRGDESDGDEQFVRDLAARLDVECFVRHFDTADLAAQQGLSIQMLARELRYRWFEELSLQKHYHYIAVAHHQSDSTETVLLNLTRGTGIAGMHGILPKRGCVIRPLLFLKREEIDQLVSAHNIDYREDASNASDKYARNKIRLKVIPQLKILNPSLDETFTANSERFAEIEMFLQQQVDLLRERIFRYKSKELIEIPLNELMQLKPAKLLCYELLKDYGFNESTIEDLVNGWNGLPGRKYESRDHLLLYDREKLLLMPKKHRPSLRMEIAGTEVSLSFLGSKIRSYLVPADDLNIDRSGNIAYFDYELLQFPLCLRLWEQGDYFCPFGMKGKKKLSDFFISEKLPENRKHDLPILANGNGDILWIVGMRSDNRYRITEKTRKVLIFESEI